MITEELWSNMLQIKPKNTSPDLNAELYLFLGRLLYQQYRS